VARPPEPHGNFPMSSPPPHTAPFAQWAAARCDQVEQALAACLPSPSTTPARLHEAMRYAVLDGGKRVRPLLVYAAGELTGASSAALDAAACALECIHAYSLVHDDLPCMDNDVLRRGKPTVHVAYGEATAMLVGDALQALAFQSLAGARDHGVAPAAVVDMTLLLAGAAGSIGMAGGQAIDLDAVGASLSRAALEDMHQRKTGALLAAAVQLGAACGQPPDAEQSRWLRQYASAVGLAFQVVDDILDVVGDAASLGKTAGKDAEQGKPTYVSVLGLAASRELADTLLKQAQASVAALGPGARRLGDIAELIVLRQS
jgi:farnesyl diphosphate synthase